MLVALTKKYLRKLIASRSTLRPVVFGCTIFLFDHVFVCKQPLFMEYVCTFHVCWARHCSAAAAAKSLQSCLTLCDPIDSSPSGSAVPGILQARTLEWVGISFSNVWKWKGKVKSLSRVRLVATPWTAGYQAPLSMGFSRQEYWSGVPLPSPTWRRGCLYLLFVSLQRAWPQA